MNKDLNPRTNTLPQTVSVHCNRDHSDEILWLKEFVSLFILDFDIPVSDCFY